MAELTDKTLLDTTTPGQSGPGNNGIEGYTTFPKTPGEEVHRQIV